MDWNSDLGLAGVPAVPVLDPPRARHDGLGGVPRQAWRWLRRAGPPDGRELLQPNRDANPRTVAPFAPLSVALHRRLRHHRVGEDWPLVEQGRQHEVSALFWNYEWLVAAASRTYKPDHPLTRNMSYLASLERRAGAGQRGLRPGLNILSHWRHAGAEPGSERGH
jgi:hypothetical protein